MIDLDCIDYIIAEKRQQMACATGARLSQLLAECNEALRLSDRQVAEQEARKSAKPVLNAQCIPVVVPMPKPEKPKKTAAKKPAKKAAAKNPEPSRLEREWTPQRDPFGAAR